MKAAIRRFLFMAAATVVTLLVVVAAHAIVLPIEKDVQGRPLVDADCPNDQLSCSLERDILDSQQMQRHRWTSRHGYCNPERNGDSCYHQWNCGKIV